MKAHITDRERSEQLVQEKMMETIKKHEIDAFMAGAQAVSKIAMDEYIPSLEKAISVKNMNALTKLNSLKTFLSNGEKLK